MIVYNSNGIIEDLSLQEIQEKEFYLLETSKSDFSYPFSDKIFEIESLCFKVRLSIARKIFGDELEYYNIIENPLGFICSKAGIDSDINISKAELQEFIQDYEDKEMIHKILYYFDIENILGTIQNSLVETHFAFSEFYRQLNINTFLIGEEPLQQNGLQFASGAIVTNITSLVNRIFICLYSILDFTTKLCFEVENIQSEFTNYPKLKCKDILIGDAKKVSFISKENTIFNRTEFRKIIEYLRNEIVHNASIDSIPKVYTLIENETVIEKFILLPDFNSGIIETLKNRKRFFKQENKLNELLPKIMEDYYSRLHQTISEINNYCR